MENSSLDADIEPKHFSGASRVNSASLLDARGRRLHTEENLDPCFPVSLSDLTLRDNALDGDKQTIYKTLAVLRKSALSIPNRLRSILSDAEFVVSLRRDEFPLLPLIANERCGSWYIPPSCRMLGKKDEYMYKKVDAITTTCSSAYFKSTDGHYGQWALSRRRLNLQVLNVLGQNGGAILVDSTRRGKALPDALRRTVPIWAAVWNQILFDPARCDLSSVEKTQATANESRQRDSKTSAARREPTFRQGRFQSCGLEDHEVSQIEKCIPGWVDDILKLDLDLESIRRQLKRPIRCRWVVNGEGHILPDGWSEEVPEDEPERWNMLVLCSASRRVLGAEMSDDGYIQGAGDDSEGWSHGLTARLFWEHKDRLIHTSEDEIPRLIQTLLNEDKNVSVVIQPILIPPTVGLFIAAGMLLQEDTSLQKYDLVIDCGAELAAAPKNSIALGCPSGKLGSRMLRGKLIQVKQHVNRVIKQSRQNARILVMDEGGNDLCVGVALMILCLFYTDEGSVVSQDAWHSIDKHLVKKRLAWITSAKPDANPSRSTLQAVNSFLIERPP